MRNEDDNDEKKNTEPEDPGDTTIDQPPERMPILPAPPDPQLGFGTFALVENVTVAHGLTEINDALDHGWKLLSVHIVDELIEGGTGTRRRVIRPTPVAILGRAFYPGEDRLRGREDAIDAGEASLNDAMSIRVARSDEDDDDDADVRVSGSVAVESGNGLDRPRPPASRRRQPAAEGDGYRTTRGGGGNGEGTTQVKGLRA